MATRKLQKKDSMNDENHKYVCFHCKEPLLDKEFYNSYSDVYDEKIPICKKCFWNLFIELKEKYNSVHKAIFRMCSLFDIYYDKNVIDGIYEKYKEEEKTDIVYIIRDYMRQMNSLPQNDGKTFQDSDTTQKVANVETIIDNGLETNVKNWGKGYNKEQYDILNYKYESWCTTAPHTDHADIVVLRNICKVELVNDEKLARGEAVKSTSDQLRGLIQMAGLDGKSRKNEEDTNKSNLCWGKIVQQVETTRPCEFYGDKKMSEDWMGYGDNYKNYYIRPLRNMVENRRDFPDVTKQR